jgi:hypothetical protein
MKPYDASIPLTTGPAHFFVPLTAGAMGRLLVYQAALSEKCCFISDINIQGWCQREFSIGYPVGS